MFNLERVQKRFRRTTLGLEGQYKERVDYLGLIIMVKGLRGDFTEVYKIMRGQRR